jgi:hypothetical protein
MGASHAEAGGTEELEMERQGGQAEQVTIDRYRARMEAKEARDELQERRKKLVADAGKEQGEAYNIWMAGPSESAAYRRSVDNRRALAATNEQTQRNLGDAKIMNSPEGKLLADAAAAESILQHGGQISFRQTADIHAAAVMITKALGVQGEATLEALHGQQQQILTLAKQIRSLASPP